MQSKSTLHIHILCGDSTYNRGDRANLASQINLLQTHFPGSRITTSSYRPEVDQDWYPAEFVRRKLPLSRDEIKCLRQADVIVWGGGALLIDNASRVKILYWNFVIGFVKIILRKPVMAWAHGVIFNTKLGLAAGRNVLNWVDLITVRDQNSLDAIERARVTKTPYHLTADPAVLFTPDDPATGAKILQSEGIDYLERSIFAIACTFTALHNKPNRLIPYMIAKPLGLVKEDHETLNKAKSALNDLATQLIEKYNCQVVFFPTYPAPWENDNKYFEDIVEMSEYGEQVTYLKYDNYSPNEYFAIWHHIKAIISIPMHHAIISTTMGVPCLNLFYEPKGRDFFRAIHAEERMMSVERLYEEGAEVVVKQVDSMLENWDMLSTQSIPYFQDVQDQAMGNITYLKQLLKERGLLVPHED